MESFRIDYADVILQDYGDGKGKIIISDDNWGYNFSHYWGAMGKDTLVDFLLGLDEGYFSHKLGPMEIRGSVDVKRTMARVRSSIREELPWYKHLEFQKELRSKLQDLQRNIYDDRSFVDLMERFADNLFYHDIDDRYEREEIESLMKSIFGCEPWNYLVYEEHREMIYLKKFLPKLKKYLKNEYKNIHRNQVQES